MINKVTFRQKLKAYTRTPGSLILMLLVMLAALITFTVLIFLIVYILVHGVPYLKPSLFSLHYTSENASVVPALINTVIMTLLSLLIAVPFGIFSAIFLVEYAKKRKQIRKCDPADDRNPFRDSVYRVWIVRNALFCKRISLGLFTAGRSIYHFYHDPAADHADDRGSTFSGAGLLQRRQLRTGSREAADSV